MLLPDAFVWTKMGAESGEALAAIIRRKEYERQLGGGVFAWGIGNALGVNVETLAREEAEPMAVFSAMLSKPKKADAAPSAVLLWTAYEGSDGAGLPLPPHVLVTSRGHTGDATKTRHYALLCQSDTPLPDAPGPLADVVPAALRNLTTGKPLGASQVTAVVRHTREAPIGVRAYPVAFSAKLWGDRYVRLLAPRMLSAVDMVNMTAAMDGGLRAWGDFVNRTRWP